MQNKDSSPRSSTETEPSLPELFASRIADLFRELESGEPSPDKPNWVRELERRLIKDFLGQIHPPHAREELKVWIEGLVIGALPHLATLSLQTEDSESATVAIISETVEPDERERAIAAVSVAKELGDFCPPNAFNENAISHLSSAQPLRSAFIQGLALGDSMSLKALDDLGTGGSTRRAVHVCLWIYWPRIIRCQSVADVYRRLDLAYSESGMPNTLGDAERFKKIAQDLGLKFPPKSRFGKSKASRLPIQKSS